MLFQTSPPPLPNNNGNGPALICQPSTVFPNEQVGNTVLAHFARPDSPGIYWQGDAYDLDGTLGYGTFTVEAVTTVSNYNGGNFFFNWHDVAAASVPVNGQQFLLMVDLQNFTRTDEANTYFGLPYDWPREFMINLQGYHPDTFAVEASDSKYFQMDGSCYRPVYSGDGYFSAPAYTVSEGPELFRIDEHGLTADGNTFVLIFTMQNIDPTWELGPNGVWIFGPVFPGSCRFALHQLA